MKIQKLMIKNSILTFCITGCSLVGFSQADESIEVTRNYDQLNRMDAGGTTLGSGMWTTPAPVEKMKGDVYLTSGYLQTSFLLANGDVIKDVPAKYHIPTNNFAIIYEKKEKGANGNMVEQFSFVDMTGNKRNFVSVKKFPLNPMVLNGFYEVLEDNEDYKVFAVHDIEILDSNYNVALDVGSRAPQAIKNKTYYLLQNNKYILLENFRKKNLKQAFGDNYKTVKKYIKSNDLNDEKNSDVIKVIAYYLNKV